MTEKTAKPDILQLSRDGFEKAAEREVDNRMAYVDDVRFSRLDEQWPALVKKKRELEGRPCLTINKLKNFIRQVVNDARQNKPAIDVHPADDNGDPETAEIISGLIRNIEVTSDADVATDTAIDNAVSGGFGYYRINIKDATDDSFDSDIAFERIPNPLTVYADPNSECADSSDWNEAWVVTTMTKTEFAAKHKGNDAVDWDTLGYTGLSAPWMEGDTVMVCEYWRREEVARQIVTLFDGSVVGKDDVPEGAEVVGDPKTVKSHKVTQYIMSGAEVLDTIAWPGRYIPIVPVYGDEIFIDGKRHFRSLIHSAKDTQRNFNYWRTAATELVALAPKIPFIGPKGAFETDEQKWATANREDWAYIEYDGATAPQRQQFAGMPAGAVQEALSASDDMKAVVGMYDASLGNRSNETSGIAIQRRAAEGDTATFHFIDNLSRAIRHGGRILIDLIPKVYSTERVIRILGKDMKPQNVKIAPGAQQQAPMQQPQGMQPGMQPEGQEDDTAAIQRIYDITAGKYDLTVKAGPSYGTAREQSREQIVEIIRSFPESAMVLGPMYLRNSDWPGADEAADMLEQMSSQQQQPQGPDPQAVAAIDQLKQQMQQMNEALDQAKQIISDQQQQLQENDQTSNELRVKTMELGVRGEEAKAKQIAASASHLKARADLAVALGMAPEPSTDSGMADYQQ